MYKTEHSAGGVLFKEKSVLLILNFSSKWTFPKGLVEEGESAQDTAIREVYEETGIKGRVIGYLGKIQYWYVWEGIKIKKTVDYFLMEYVEGEIKPSFEVKDAAFFPLDKAKELLTYKGDKQVFQKAILARGV